MLSLMAVLDCATDFAIGKLRRNPIRVSILVYHNARDVCGDAFNIVNDIVNGKMARCSDRLGRKLYHRMCKEMKG